MTKALGALRLAITALPPESTAPGARLCAEHQPQHASWLGVV